MPEQENRVGEVIETGTAEFTAQCYELYQSPPLGSLVKAGDESIHQYAIVYNTTTSSIEPGRRPIARGKDESSEEGVYQSSPQLLKLLRTEFSTLIVGFREGDKVFHYLPPRPVKIHSFVYECADEEIKEFSESFDFLNILINSSLAVPVEEIVAASLRRMSRVYDEPQRFLVSAGKELATLMGNDFNRLKSVLSKIN
ncbi:MAG: hypothetical protein JSU58_07480 [Dehalococcoidales bacterium]|nr:MAG: hypothetical protein JSU58_07480 [Dehalococcoidales bacterium]